MPYEYAGATVDEARERVTVTLASRSSEEWAGYRTAEAHDVEGCAIEITVLEVPTARDASAYLYVSSFADDLIYVRLHKTGTVISFYDTSSGNAATTPDKPEIERWRLVFDSEGVRAEVFAGAAWSPVGGAPMPGFVDSARIELGAGSSAVVSDPGVFVVDRLAAGDPSADAASP